MLETAAMGAATPRKPNRSTPSALKAVGIFLRLPPDLIADIDAIAEKEYRTRARTIELVLRQFVENWKRGASP
jgi:hypothetical protein